VRYYLLFWIPACVGRTGLEGRALQKTGTLFGFAVVGEGCLGERGMKKGRFLHLPFS
jgi:hypothetical protein